MQSKWQFALHSGSFKQLVNSTAVFAVNMQLPLLHSATHFVWTSHSQCIKNIYLVSLPTLYYKCMVNQSLAYIHSRSGQQS